MADVKISALPLATTPLAGTEVLPIVQSATTDQVSVANLTAGRAVSAASLTLTTTPLAVGSGGTGLSTLTTGQILYPTSSSAIGSSSNLFWDATNSQLGIGTSTPANKLQVIGSTNIQGGTFQVGTLGGGRYASITSNGLVTIRFDDNSTPSILTLQNLGVNGVDQGAQIIANLGSDATNAYNGGFIKFGNSGTYTATASTQNSYLAFATALNGNNTERMRIDSSGNLLVGTVVANSKVYGVSGANSPVGRFDATLTSGYISEAFQVICGQPSGTGFKVAAFYINNAAGYAAYIRGDGTIFAVSTTIQAVSDARLKENIRDVSEGLDIILSLKPRRFDWKEGKGNGKKDQIGFIAQEVETVFPDAIDVWDEPNDDTEYKSVGSSVLIPVLVKAIQELAAEVAELKAKVA